MTTIKKNSDDNFFLNLSDVPINEIQRDVVWIKIKASSKMKNLISFALQSIQKKNCQILLTGIGAAIGITNIIK